jgi:hypothetical protein
MSFTLTSNHTSTSTASGVNTLALAYGSSPTVNNVLVVVGVTYSSASVVSLADSIVNTWSSFANLPYASTTDGATLGMWWCINKSTAADTVTLTWTGTATGCELYVAEFVPSGVVSVDGTSGGAQGTTGTINTPTITTTGSSDLLLAYCSSANALTVNTPWTLLGTQSGDDVIYALGQPAGTYNPNFTQTSGTFAAVIGALKAAGSAASLGANQQRLCPTQPRTALPTGGTF